MLSVSLFNLFVIYLGETYNLKLCRYIHLNDQIQIPIDLKSLIQRFANYVQLQQYCKGSQVIGKVNYTSLMTLPL